MSSILRNLDSYTLRQWEMASFEENKPRFSEPTSPPDLPPAPVLVSMITEDELAEIRHTAKQEAYAQAYQIAYEKGLREGQDAGRVMVEEQMQPSAESMRLLLQNFAQELDGMANATSQALLELALELAEKMLKVKLELAPETILPIVQAAIAGLPNKQSDIRILLNPLDVEIVKKSLGEHEPDCTWQVAADPHLERGGCKIETSHNIIDASLDTRWQHLLDIMRNH